MIFDVFTHAAIPAHLSGFSGDVKVKPAKPSPAMRRSVDALAVLVNNLGTKERNAIGACFSIPGEQVTVEHYARAVFGVRSAK